MPLRVKLLTPLPLALLPIVQSTGDTVVDWTGEPELVLSYNHPLILTPAELARCPHINLHISMLPYNRGRDPNFWSWFDGTPKGVSIHYMDAGVDTGPLLTQMEASWSSNPITLADTYADLQRDILRLFAQQWAWLRTLPPGRRQPPGGSHHFRRDKTPFFSLLPLGWNTPVVEVEEMGAEHHASAGFWRKYEEEIDADRRTRV